MFNSTTSTDTTRLAGAIARQLAWAHRATEPKPSPATSQAKTA